MHDETITVTHVHGAPVVLVDGEVMDVTPAQATAIYEAMRIFVLLAVDAPNARPRRELPAE